MSEQTSDYKYWAFISYSHADRAWGDWLIRKLETYRVPRRLVGRTSRDGQVPARLFPVFRDRDELPTSADLGGVIDRALAQSRYQIVICSPRSAASRWVNEEVKHFKSLGRGGRVLCLIVDGEPNASDQAGREAVECFAPALRFEVDAGRQLTDRRVEPIAADARAHADGKSGALLKLLAGL
ncbi:MAG TPA: toll/interleukin-1 receptor domain-containing protein, partial [Nevskiaceae bacterium]|nr:toll/interleukin-1 receptor domain-containing protein [Nevskiaceae bacterium]